MSEEIKHVVITDIRMPFFSMVIFMVKWVIASIPAFFILAIILSIFMATINKLGGMINY